MKKEWTDPVLKISSYHQEISESKDFLEVIPENLTKEKMFIRIKDIDDFYNEKLMKHFQMEEETLFPLALNNGELSSLKPLIKELEQEHNEILSLIEQFQQIVYAHVFPLKNEWIVQLNAILGRIIFKLIDHAVKEDKQFLPQIKKHLLNAKTIKQLPPESHAEKITELLNMMHLMAGTELVVARFYRAAATANASEQNFFLHIAKQEVQHSNNIRKMIYHISRAADKFTPKSLWDIKAIHDFNALIFTYIHKIETGMLNLKGLLETAGKIEGSLLEKDYHTLVDTNDQEYLNFAAEMSVQVSDHQKMIAKKTGNSHN